MAQIASILAIRIPVQDLKRATAFYRDALGLDYEYDAEGCAYFKLSSDTRIILDPELKGPAGAHFYFLNHEDIEGAYQKLLDAGAQSVKNPYETNHFRDRDRWEARLLDTEGNLFGVVTDIWNGYC